MAGRGGLRHLLGMAFAAWCAVSAFRAGVLRDATPLPRHAKYAVVLDGQGSSGSRANRGLELLRQGRVDTLVLSGVPVGGGVFYSMIWARMLPLDSAERGRVLEMRSGSSGTRDEARLIDSIFGSSREDTVVVVSSAYHVWRTASILRRVAKGKAAFAVAGAEDPVWNRGLRDREGQKMRLQEWTKRLHWTLYEQWTEPRSPLPWAGIARGAELGLVPPSAWK